jgi:Domain of unknown function (DUF4252)
MKTMTRWMIVASLVVPCWGQTGPQIDMKNLQALESKAEQVVSVNLEGQSLDEGSKLLAIRNGVSKSVKELVKGLKGVYLRRFWFGGKQSYEDADVEPIRKELQRPGWAPMIDVKNRNKSEAVAVYSYTENNRLTGVTVFSADDKEVTVVNIVGPVDLEALSELGKQMGLPAMHLATTDLTTQPPASVPAPAK